MQPVVSTSAEFERTLYEIGRDIKRITADIADWLQQLSLAEQILGVCLFGLVMMFLIVRKPKSYKQGGGMARQFVLALGIVLLFSFGIGYYLEGIGVIRDLF